MKTTISKVKNYEGQEVTIGCWLENRRSSGKIAFLQLRDGTGFMQGVVSINDVSEEVFELAKSMGQESSMYITGKIVEDNRSQLGYEMHVTNIELIHNSVDYPITPKEHGIEFLMNNRHLWLRSRRQHAIMRIRDRLIKATYDFFYENDFIKIDPPIITGSSAEGTTDLFYTDYFGEEAYSSQSGQLYMEAAAMAHGKVFSFGPTFRAEKSHTRKHLIEFWMIEPEMAFVEHDESLKVQEAYVCYLVNAVLEDCQAELKTLGRDLERLKAVQAPFPQITYDEAIDMLHEMGFDDIQWGDDFGAPHETAIAEKFDRPVFIKYFPAEIKAFYMKPHPERPEVVLCADLIAPEGYGEIIGGSERISDLDLMKERYEQHNLTGEAYEWYLELRKYGTVPHSGFGLGFERVVAWITGVDHIRETIPFPRLLNRLHP